MSVKISYNVHQILNSIDSGAGIQALAGLFIYCSNNHKMLRYLQPVYALVHNSLIINLFGW